MTQATPDEQTAGEFERLRPYLLRVAYSHLGSLGEAEDVVQEATLETACGRIPLLGGYAHVHRPLPRC
jgi:DNA-directed RNA polymerase specialized sigma24 family protein